MHNMRTELVHEVKEAKKDLSVCPTMNLAA
jgi:hypothetical protein